MKKALEEREQGARDVADKLDKYMPKKVTDAIRSSPSLGVIPMNMYIMYALSLLYTAFTCMC
jgi:hypothetical protein